MAQAKTFTDKDMKKMLKSLEFAGDELWHYIYDRTKRLPGDRVYLGPNFDTCFYYWLGGAGGGRASSLEGLIGDEHNATLKHNMPLAKRDFDYLTGSSFADMKDLRYIFQEINLEGLGSSEKPFKFGGKDRDGTHLDFELSPGEHLRMQGSW